MPRVRSQLAIQAPPELLIRVRDVAEARGRTITSVVLEWIEAGLAGEAAPSPAPAADDARVAALEAELVKLAARVTSLEHTPRPRRAALGEIVAAPAPAAPQPALADDPVPVAPVPLVMKEEGITTAELAERTSTNRAGWNNWAARSAPGAVRQHETAGAWRLVGKVAPPAGGPERWIWKPA
jgi:hypothetical protein